MRATPLDGPADWDGGIYAGLRVSLGRAEEGTESEAEVEGRGVAGRLFLAATMAVLVEASRKISLGTGTSSQSGERSRLPGRLPRLAVQFLIFSLTLWSFALSYVAFCFRTSTSMVCTMTRAHSHPLRAGAGEAQADYMQN